MPTPKNQFPIIDWTMPTPLEGMRIVAERLGRLIGLQLSHKLRWIWWCALPVHVNRQQRGLVLMEAAGAFGAKKWCQKPAPDRLTEAA